MKKNVSQQKVVASDAKKVFRKLSNTVTLKNLSSTTTLEDLSKMLVEDSFKISDLVFQESDYAEFKSEIEDMLDELKSTDAQNMIDAINRMYTESMFQIQWGQAPSCHV